MRKDFQYLSLLFCLDHRSSPGDKHLQEFILFVKHPDIQKLIEKLRKSNRISIETCKKRMKRYDELLERKNKIFNKIINQVKKARLPKESIFPKSKYFSQYLEIEKKNKYYEANEKISKYGKKLEEYLWDRLDIGDVRTILMDCNKPISWETSLAAYILLGTIVDPAQYDRCYVRLKDSEIELEISADASPKDLRECFPRITRLKKMIRKTLRFKNEQRDKPCKIYKKGEKIFMCIPACSSFADMENARKKVCKLQEQMKGVTIKKTRNKSKFSEKIIILDAAKQHNNIYNVIDQIYGDFEETKSTGDLDRKRRRVIRKTKSRYVNRKK